MCDNATLGDTPAGDRHRAKRADVLGHRHGSFPRAAQGRLRLARRALRRERAANFRQLSRPRQSRVYLRSIRLLQWIEIDRGDSIIPPVAGKIIPGPKGIDADLLERCPLKIGVLIEPGDCSFGQKNLADAVIHPAEIPNIGVRAHAVVMA